MKASFCSPLVIIHPLHFEPEKNWTFQNVSAWLVFILRSTMSSKSVARCSFSCDEAQESQSYDYIKHNDGSWWAIYTNTSFSMHRPSWASNCFYVLFVFLMLLPYEVMIHHHNSYDTELCDDVLKGKVLKMCSALFFQPRIFILF